MMFVNLYKILVFDFFEIKKKNKKKIKIFLISEHNQK